MKKIIAVFIFLIINVSLNVNSLEGGLTDQSNADENEKKIHDFIENLFWNIQHNNAKGIAETFFYEVLRAWEIPSDYEENTTNVSSDAQLFPGIQFSKIGDIPETSFYHKVLFKKLSPEELKYVCDESYYTAPKNYIDQNPKKVLIKQLLGPDKFFSKKYNADITRYTFTLKSKFIDSCELKLPSTTIYLINNRIYLANIVFFGPDWSFGLISTLGIEDWLQQAQTPLN